MTSEKENQNTLIDNARALITAVTYAGITDLPNGAGKGFMARIPAQFIEDIKAAIALMGGVEASSGNSASHSSVIGPNGDNVSWTAVGDVHSCDTELMTKATLSAIKQRLGAV